MTWLLVAYLVAIGRERMNKLRRNRDALPDPAPLVTILIPAKDEGSRIRDCVQDVLKQTYPSFEVIAINDRSTDDTGAILDTFATSQDVLTISEDTRQHDQERRGSAATQSPHPVRVVHIRELPAGWLGKCHALDHGATHARGEWLFFVDSDVRLKPDALSRMAATSIAREYDALSILTTIETHTFIEKLMLPLLAGTWMTMFQGDQTNEDSEPEKALANGQAFLIRRSAYEKVGGHAAVKDRIVEDVELMRTLKKAGCRTRFLAGRELAATRMHTNLPQMFNGWARIFAGTARGRVWPMGLAVGFLLLGVLSLAPAVVRGCHTGEWATIFATGPHGSHQFTPWSVTFWQHGVYWAAAAAIHWLLMTIVAAFVWRWSGNRPWYALLLPIGVVLEIVILVYAIRKAFSGKIDWRGSAVDLRQTSRVSDRPTV